MPEVCLDSSSSSLITSGTWEGYGSRGTTVESFFSLITPKFGASPICEFQLLPALVIVVSFSHAGLKLSVVDAGDVMSLFRVL